MAFSIINRAFSPDYELTRSIIKIKHLNENDPDITQKVSQLRMADSVKKAVYELLAASIIKENHLNKSDPDIKQKIDKLGIDDSVKKAVYGILRFS